MNVDVRVAETEERYIRNHSVDGVSFVAYDTGRLATDDDNALFTGLQLGAMSLRALSLGHDRYDLADDAMSGIELLTRVSGTPGVLVRQAFPLEDSWNRIGYDPIMSLQGDTNTFGHRIREGRVYHGEYQSKEYAFLTKTTKDQITGVLFGLTFAGMVPSLRERAGRVVVELWERMQETGYSLVDHAGNTHGTTAHELDEPLRLLLDALHLEHTGEGDLPSSWFFHPFWNWLMTLHYNRTIQNTYSYNLNLLVANSLSVLNHKNERGVRDWTRRVYRKVESDSNPHFDLLANLRMSPRSRVILERRMNDPYHKGFCWSRDPDEWFDKQSSKIGPGIDVMLPYWMDHYLEPNHARTPT